MNDFMRQVYEDVDNIFMSQEWVAQKRLVNGTEMPVVVDTEKLSELRKYSQGKYAEDLYRAELLIFVKPADLGYPPAKGSIFKLDGDVYRVIEVTGETLYRIILGDVR